jgi:nucleoside-diphosphate-sugar epimerase
MAKWFSREPDLHYLPWDEWRKQVPENDATATWDHIAHSPNCSIAKARRLLAYQPRYTSLQAVQEAVDWLIHNDSLLD